MCIYPSVCEMCAQLNIKTQKLQVLQICMPVSDAPTDLLLIYRQYPEVLFFENDSSDVRYT